MGGNWGKWGTLPHERTLTAYTVIACFKLTKNNGNLPLPFFGGNYPIVILDNIY